jgi:hypothetical protein
VQQIFGHESEDEDSQQYKDSATYSSPPSRRTWRPFEDVRHVLPQRIHRLSKVHLEVFPFIGDLLQDGWQISKVTVAEVVVALVLRVEDVANWWIFIHEAKWRIWSRTISSDGRRRGWWIWNQGIFNVQSHVGRLGDSSVVETGSLHAASADDERRKQSFRHGCKGKFASRYYGNFEGEGIELKDDEDDVDVVCLFFVISVWWRWSNRLL